MTRRRSQSPGLGPTAPGAQRAEVVVPRELEGERLDKALATLVEDMSRGLARKTVGMGAVYIGRERCRVASRKVRAGDLLTATWHPAVSAPRRFELDLVHHDARVVVVCKPSGQLVQGTELGDEGTLVRQLEQRFGEGLRLMHRLDVGASGLLVATRDRDASKHLTPQFRGHTIVRSYLAITETAPPEGPCERPLRRRGRKVRVAEPDDPEAMSARTVFSVLETSDAPHRALVQAQLYTGRTHQIRVHLQSLGAPIVGDDSYGGLAAPRLCLHARELGFLHPDDNREVRFVRPPGADFWKAGQVPEPSGD